MARIVQMVCGLLFVLLGLAFHIKNSQPVILNFYFRTIELPLSWAMVAALILGSALGALAMLKPLLGLRRALGRQHRQSDIARQELAQLRAAPPQDGL